ncbi:MAG: HAD family phosphatase [Thermodesulfobacteriota bacterium]|nr:HAD family phosphatase [Thermodesulfobacteriota bacterium]
MTTLKETIHPSSKPCTVDAIFFDFGGVLAEEGFRNGLVAIAKRNGLEPSGFARTGFELVFEVGYVLGRSDEKAFWAALREKTHIKDPDSILRDKILSHFRLRPWMLDLVKKLKQKGMRLAILSDQTNWLDELNARYSFFRWFEHVFNSYHLGKSKKDISVFEDVLAHMGVQAGQALFVDDHESHIDRANGVGLHTIWYVDRQGFELELASFCPHLMADSR